MARRMTLLAAALAVVLLPLAAEAQRPMSLYDFKTNTLLGKPAAPTAEGIPVVDAPAPPLPRSEMPTGILERKGPRRLVSY